MSRFIFLVYFSFFVAKTASAFIVPPLTGPVVDLVGVLPQKNIQLLTEGLSQLYRNQGTQIQVVILKQLDDLPIEEASIKIVDEWKLGHKGSDRGVLLLIAMKEHKARIEVGRGLEGDLPDVIAKRIIDHTLVPLFKQKDYSGGILLTLYEITKRSDPQFDFQSAFSGLELSSTPSSQKNKTLEIILLILFILFFGGFINPLGLLGGMGRGGPWGGGGNWPSGGGSGGWSSGGGGGFSGGGASGDW
ncbi:MAG: TPM domain-containing protein [Bdellovibrionales bacterium]|nr:TPM domain-containing protein [Bdellovibrionales bacterium]